MRIIPDLRRANLALRKEEISPVMTQAIQKIATRAIQLRRLFPDTEMLPIKRDIAKAPKLIPVSPRLMRCLRHVFKAVSSGASSGIVGCFLSLPFGWVSPPSFFASWLRLFKKFTMRAGPRKNRGISDRRIGPSFMWMIVCPSNRVSEVDRKTVYHRGDASAG